MPEENSREFIAEIGDTILEATTDLEVLDKIPVVSWLVKAYEITQSFQTKRLHRNCAAFVQAARSGDTSKLKRQLAEIAEDKKRREDFVDTVGEILLNGEKPLKAFLLGRVLVALAGDHLTSEQFDTISLLLLNGSIPALRAVPFFFELSHGESSIQSRDAGGTEPLLLSLGVASRYGTAFRISECGCLLYEYGFGKPRDGGASQ